MNNLSMRISSYVTSHRGFSILVALGTVGVLLIMVMGLATLYANELKLSRMQYNNILAYAGSEGAFEYAMLKIRNHREGFADEMTSNDLEAGLLRGNTDRTKTIDLHYTILANATHAVFSVSTNEHLIIPLFSAQGNAIHGSSTSKNPIYTNAITPVTSLQKVETNGGENDISWSIIGMKNGVSVGLAGTGNITSLKTGILRKSATDCYDSMGMSMACNGGEKEVLDYFYDETMGVDAFLNSGISDPYLLLYNAGTNANITIDTNVPFALPKLEITTEARKGNALQSIRFQEDKTRYYDALKYGIYNSGL